MRRKGLVTLLAVYILLSLYLFPTGQVTADEYKTEDYWVYNAEHFLEGLAIIGTTRIDFGGEHIISVGGTDYDTIYFTWSGVGTFSGTASGLPVSGNVTLTGEQYFQESNQEWIISNENYLFDGTYTLPESSGDWVLTYDTKTSYDLSVDQKVLKSEVGDLGRSEATVTLNVTTQVEMDGYVVDSSSQNVTFEEDKSYACIKKETLTVSAGTFDSYLINTSYADGTYKHDWRSTKVGNSVKMATYDQNGEELWSMELTEYHHQEPTTDDIFGFSPSTFFVIASLVIVAVIILVFFLSTRLKR